jgi:hypothetical protein
MNPPKTNAEFMALPVRAMVGSWKIDMRDGREIRIPVAHQFNVLPMLDGDTLFLCFDESGQEWRLAHDTEGYCRVRR